MTVKQTQCLLTYLGFYGEPVDGLWGPATAAALRRFQKEQGITADGLPGEESGEKLRQAVGNDDRAESFWDGVRYFRRAEYACPCGKCGGFPAEPREKLVLLEDKVRAHFGRPILNSSGVRCRSHNAAVGGVSNSRHLTGQAVDFTVVGCTAKTVADWVRQQPETAYCYAIDGSYVHMDVV